MNEGIAGEDHEKEINTSYLIDFFSPTFAEGRKYPKVPYFYFHGHCYNFRHFIVSTFEKALIISGVRRQKRRKQKSSVHVDLDTPIQEVFLNLFTVNIPSGILLKH